MSVSEMDASTTCAKRKSEPGFVFETASGKPNLPPAEMIAAARIRLRQSELAASGESGEKKLQIIPEDKENERPAKRYKSRDQMLTTAGSDHSVTGTMLMPALSHVMAGDGDGPHVNQQPAAKLLPEESEAGQNQNQVVPVTDVTVNAGPTSGSKDPAGDVADQNPDDDEEEQFEESFLDSPDCDLSHLFAKKSPYFPDDSAASQGQ